MAARRKKPAPAKKSSRRKRSPSRTRRKGADAAAAGFVRLEVRGLQQLSQTSLQRLLRRACQHAVDLRAGHKPHSVPAMQAGGTPCDDEGCTLLEQITLPDGIVVRIFNCNGAVAIYVVA